MIKPKWCTRKTLGWLMLAVPYVGLYFTIPDIMIAATGAALAMIYLIAAIVFITDC